MRLIGVVCRPKEVPTQRVSGSALVPFLEMFSTSARKEGVTVMHVGLYGAEGRKVLELMLYGLIAMLLVALIG